MSQRLNFLGSMAWHEITEATLTGNCNRRMRKKSEGKKLIHYTWHFQYRRTMVTLSA